MDLVDRQVLPASAIYDDYVERLVCRLSSDVMCTFLV